MSNGEGNMHENKLPYSSQLGEKTINPNSISISKKSICLPVHGWPAQWSGLVAGRKSQIERIDLLHDRDLGLCGLEQVYGSWKGRWITWVVFHSTILPSLWRLFRKGVAWSAQAHEIRVPVTFASIPARMQKTKFAIHLVFDGQMHVLKLVVAAAKFPKTNSDLGHAVASKGYAQLDMVDSNDHVGLTSNNAWWEVAIDRSGCIYSNYLPMTTSFTNRRLGEPAGWTLPM